MEDKKYEEFFKRYHKFKNNNLPTPFYDEERHTLEYVFHRKDVPWYLAFDETNDDYKYTVEKDIVDSLGSLTGAGFYYSFECGSYNWDGNDYSKTVGHTHAHSFSEVVDCLYKFPESFKINKDDEQYFSQQELKYLRRVQKYLLFIGVKDIANDEDTDRIRYINEKQKKYEDVYIYTYSNERIDDIIAHKIIYSIPDDITYYKDNKELDYKALIFDEDDNSRLLVRYINEEKKQFKDIKDIISIDNINDDDYMIIDNIEVIEVYDKDIA